MKNFCMPDYRGGSIVNLMSSIARSFNVKNSYVPLKILPPSKIKSKNVVLLVIDGLGYEYLKGRKSVLNDYLVGPMTSTFLPSTACAAVAFMTGVAPQQHGLTGWYMFFKEFGIVSLSLSFCPRMGGKSFNKYGFPIETVFTQEPFQNKLKNKVQCFTVNPTKFLYSDFNRFVAKGSKKLHYKTMDGLFRQIQKAINSGSKRKYIYAYWGNLDGLAHKNGIGSKKVKRHFNQFDKKIRKFIEYIKKTDTTLIITSDHGLIDTPLNKIIKIENHPELKECLTFPPCGDSRVAYCYVRPIKTKQFEKYVKSKLSKYFWMFKGEDLIKKNYYGLGKPNPRLFDRVGDYVLVAKENYIVDSSFKKKKKLNIGHHGGVSRDEMIVPLVVVQPKH